jgi:hypothetical protein
MTVAVDFSPGLHGHFLELLVNKYIYGIDFNGDRLFQSSGALHSINTNQEYQENKIAAQGHYSAFKFPYHISTKKVIFIKHQPVLDFVLLTNIYYRCHEGSINVADYDVKEIIAFHQKFLDTNSELESRNNWFAKLNERHFEQTEIRPKTNLPVYYFDYGSFFNLNTLCDELKKTADFLENTFRFDESLSHLWSEFIAKNQGWEIYQQGNNILSLTLQGNECSIPDDWKLHAYLNYRLGKMFDLYDGELYNNPIYPKTTSELLAIIKSHLLNFDTRF